MKLSQLFLILLARRRIILLTVLITVGISTLVSLLIPKSFTASTSVLIDFKGSDPITGTALPAQLLPGYMATQVDIISSHNVALKVINSLKLAEVPAVIEEFNQATHGKGSIQNWLADALLKDLEVKPSRESSVISISYSGADPQYAAELANAFAQSYIQTNLELRVEPARNQALWFDKQIKTLRTAVADAQKRLSDYQQQTGIIALDERLDVENSRLAELSSQLVAAEAQTYDNQTRERQVRSASGKGKLAETPDILSSGLIQELKAELARAEAKLAEISERVDTHHPQYQSAQAEVSSLRKKIASEMQTARGSIANAASQARQREDELTKALAEQKAKVLELKQQRDQITFLMREVESTQRAFDNATQRADQLRLESQRNQTEIAVLNPAVPPLKHAKPRLLLNIALSLVLGGLLGIGMGLLLEMLDRRVRTAEDIEEGLGMPVLAVISSSRPLAFARQQQRHTSATTEGSAA